MKPALQQKIRKISALIIGGALPFLFWEEAHNLAPFLQNASIWSLLKKGNLAEAEALINFEKTAHNQKIFEQGIAAYLRGDFERSAFLFGGIMAQKEIQKDTILPKEEVWYMLGNSLYRFGETQSPAEQQELWKASVQSYEKSLREKYTEKSWKNLEFVRAKLKDLSEKNNPSSPKKPQEWDDGQGDADMRSLEEKMKEAEQKDFENQQYLRPDGTKKEILPQDLLPGGRPNTDPGKDW